MRYLGAGSSDELHLVLDGQAVRRGVYDEQFSVLSLRNNVSPTVFSGNYDIRTHNDLLGVQVGGQMDFQYQRWFASVSGRVAPSVNFADQEIDVDLVVVRIRRRPETPLHRTRHQEGQSTNSACISEMNLQVGYQLQPNVRLRFSYDFEWLTSVALATSQLSQIAPGGNPQRIVVSNGQFLNGMSAGLDLTW